MRVLMLALSMIFVLGCSNDFELNEPKVETPVVYGVLDPHDVNQFIRVERAFADPDVSGLDIAQNADSLYYDAITVKLIKNGQEFVGEQVDGADFGLPRDADGVFASSPNTLYRFSTEELDLQDDDVVQLSIEGIFDDKAVTSETTIITRPGLTQLTELEFLDDRELVFRWGPRAGHVNYALELQFNLVEVNINDGIQTPVSLIWKLGQTLDDTEYTVQPLDFYQFIGGALEADENIIRFMENAEFRLTAGDQILAEANRIASSNLGITASGEVPNFTNLSTGLGIFAAKHTREFTGIPLGGDTKENLKNNPFTSDLNFE